MKLLLAIDFPKALDQVTVLVSDYKRKDQEDAIAFVDSFFEQGITMYIEFDTEAQTAIAQPRQ